PPPTDGCADRLPSADPAGTTATDPGHAAPSSDTAQPPLRRSVPPVRARQPRPRSLDPAAQQGPPTSRTAPCPLGSPSALTTITTAGMRPAPPKELIRTPEKGLF